MDLRALLLLIPDKGRVRVVWSLPSGRMELSGDAISAHNMLNSQVLAHRVKGIQAIGNTVIVEV